MLCGRSGPRYNHPPSFPHEIRRVAYIKLKRVSLHIARLGIIPRVCIRELRINNSSRRVMIRPPRTQEVVLRVILVDYLEVVPLSTLPWRPTGLNWRRGLQVPLVSETSLRQSSDARCATTSSLERTFSSQAYTNTIRHTFRMSFNGLMHFQAKYHDTHVPSYRTFFLWLQLELRTNCTTE